MDTEATSATTYQFTPDNNGGCGLVGQLDELRPEGNIPPGILPGYETTICPVLNRALVRGVIKKAFGNPYSLCDICHSSKSVTEVATQSNPDP